MLAVAALLVLVSAWVFAQLPHQAAYVGQVNPEVNTALYGGGVPASVRYAGAGNSSVPMRSELRHAYWQSGALPSDVRMGYAELGPMNPGGPMAYIPSATPSYLPQTSTAPPAASGASAYSGGSIRYSNSAPPSSNYIAPRAVTAPQVSPALVTPGPINSGPINGGPINSGAIRYGR